MHFLRQVRKHLQKDLHLTPPPQKKERKKTNSLPPAGFGVLGPAGNE